MSIKLRELIRAVRACKTQAEERAVIAKECALIRTAFKENNLGLRHRNMAKLLFVQMLGYPSHFGQMECLKLIASPNFPEKRIGYLALMLLLDERTEVLTLVTNSLKNDLEHESQYVVGLSLTSVGNLATGDMARTLVGDVARHLGSSNPYLRKKAALAMIRICKRVPELAEDYIDRMVALLKDRSHGVLVAAVQLMIQVLVLADTGDSALAQVRPRFARVVPSLVKMLRNLLNLGYSPEHDIAGIADPFLQVKLLRLLQMLGYKNDEASEAMNDVLAQVATNTETNRNAGSAILYECVRAVMTVEAEAGLRVLAVNILGRFLLNRDNNIRYVALNSLVKVVSEDAAAVQRHRATVLDCLKDPDISIRQRALELTYQLVTPQNVRELVREMLNYLVVASGADHRAHLCSRIATVVEKYAPSPKWQLEVLATMLSVAGNHCDDSIACKTVVYVCVADSALQACATHKLFHLLRDELPQVQLALVHVAVWCVGEFGESLLTACNAPPDTGAGGADSLVLDKPADTAAMSQQQNSQAKGFSDSVLTSMKRTSFEPVEVTEILGLLEAVLKSHIATVQTKSYVLTTLAKLSTKFPAGQAEISDLVAGFTTSMNLELQQRSCEYASLLQHKWAAIRPEALARMPTLDLAALTAKEDEAMYTETTDLAPSIGVGSGWGDLSQPPATFISPSVPAGPSLLDLDDIFGGGPATAPPRAALHQPVVLHHPQQQVTPQPPSSDADLLSDIFAAPPAQQPTAPQQPLALQMPLEVFAPPHQQSPALAPMPPKLARITAFEKDGLQLMMDLSRNGAAVDVLCTFRNLAPKDMERLVFQAAVPKYVAMEMQPASGTVVPASSAGVVTQLVKVTNNTPKPLMMKLRIRYVVGGRQIEEQAQVSSFPAV